MVLPKRASFNTGTRSVICKCMAIPISDKVVTIEARNCKQKRKSPWKNYLLQKFHFLYETCTVKWLWIHYNHIFELWTNKWICKWSWYINEDNLYIHLSIFSSHKWFPIFTVICSSLHRFIRNQHNDQLPVGLLAQLAGHCMVLQRSCVQLADRPEFPSGLIFPTAYYICINYWDDTYIFTYS